MYIFKLFWIILLDDVRNFDMNGECLVAIWCILLREIWKIILRKFSRSEKKLKVARLLLEYGLRIDEKGNVYLKDVKIPYSSIAKVLGIDRRTVKETIDNIAEDLELFDVYKNLLPAGPFLKDVAKTAGLRVLTIEIYHDQPGIIAHVSSILARENINILQIIAEYPEIFDNPKLYIVLEGNIRGEVIEKIMSHGAIKSVKID